MHVAHEVDEHADVHHDGGIAQLLVVPEIVVYYLQGMYGVACLEAGIGVVAVLPVHVVDVPCGRVGYFLVSAVDVHPGGVFLQVVVHEAGYVGLCFFRQVPLGDCDDGLVAEIAPGGK